MHSRSAARDPEAPDMDRPDGDPPAALLAGAYAHADPATVPAVPALGGTLGPVRSYWSTATTAYAMCHCSTPVVAKC